MAKIRSEIWLALILIPAAMMLVVIPGTWLYMTSTATPLHPKPEEAPSVTQSAPPPNWARAVGQGRQIVRAGLGEQNLPGLSVAVGVGGDLVWAEGFGYADMESRLPVTPNHRFRIGTASAMLTSAAAGMLIEQGRLKLDDEIQTQVPAFPKKQWPVTLRQVMGHMAGLISDGGDESELFSRQCARPVEALPHFAESSLRFEPGTEYRFSNYGWILVSAAVEAAAGEPFLQFMRERVFDPLGMRDTIADPSKGPDGSDDAPFLTFFKDQVIDRIKGGDANLVTGEGSGTKPIPNQVTSYFPRLNADPKNGLHMMRPLDQSCYAGASVFVSTPSDLVRFGMAINAGKLLKRDTVRLLQTPQRLASGQETDYGLGWALATVTLAGEQTRAAGHNGRMLGGMASSLLTFPERRMAVAVTSNISYADTYSLAVKLAQAFAEQGTTPAGTTPADK